MFNLAIDSKLRGCDVVAMRVEDVAPNEPASESPRRNAAKKLLFGGIALRNPIVGIADCCARAVSGHAIAAAASVMNSRRFT
jgi:hypothetical protein